MRFPSLVALALGYQKFPHNDGKWKFSYVSSFLIHLAASHLISLSILYAAAYECILYRNERMELKKATSTPIWQSDAIAADAKTIIKCATLMDDVYFAFILHAYDCNMIQAHFLPNDVALCHVRCTHNSTVSLSTLSVLLIYFINIL